MVTRGLAVISGLWALVFLLNYATREHPSLSVFDCFVALIPVILVLGLKVIGRYVVTGR